MSGRRRLLGWVLLVCWLVWLQATRGWLGARVLPTAWAPDLGLLLFLAVAARLDARLLHRQGPGYVGLVLAAAGAEVALSIQAAAPVLAGWVGVLLWQNLWRRGVDVERPLLRILIAGSAAWALVLWRDLVQGLDLAAGVAIDAPVALGGDGAWRGVLATAALAPVLMPLLLGLPGLGLYVGRR